MSQPVYYIAKFFTYLGAPPFTFAASILILGFSDLNQSVEPAAWFIALLAGMLPLVLIVGAKVSDVVTSLDLDTAMDRYIGFGLATICALLCYLLLPRLYENTGELLPFLLAHLFTTVCMFAFTCVTLRYDWKPSVHAAGAACLLFVVYYCQIPYALIWAFLLLVVISWSRLVLNKHTLGQIVVGALLGVILYPLFFLGIH